MLLRSHLGQAWLLGALFLALPNTSSARPFIPPPCGNGFIEPNEQCDDGNLIDGDGCSSICLFEGDAGASDGGVMDPIPTDGGIIVDDVGAPADANAPIDATAPFDSGGAPFDSGSTIDAGPFADAATGDGGPTPVDAGRPDSTLQVFTPPPVATVGEEGCGCSSSGAGRGSLVSALAAGLALWLCRRR